LIAATVYMTLGRFVRALDAGHYALLGTRWLTKIYVTIDFASFITQMAGSAMQGSGDAEGVKLGRTLVLSGLGIQLGALSFFILSVGIVHHRLNAQPTHMASRPSVNWRWHFWTLHVVSGLLVVRNLFRFIEFAAGHDTVLVTVEAFIYAFDAAIMALVVLVLVVVHPGYLLRSVKRSSSIDVDMGPSQKLV
jgi:hypothetical protein